VSTVAAGGYLGASASFGFLRRLLPPQLFSALAEVFVRRIREGAPHEDVQPGQSVHNKDADIDVIAWRHFRDLLPGKVILFGQVATGDWREKSLRTALIMLRRLFREPWAVGELSALFVPFDFESSTPRIPKRFSSSAWEAPHRHRLTMVDSFGIIFDRCRVAEGVARALQMGPTEQASIDEIGRLNSVTSWVDQVVSHLRELLYAA
jgi:hypothetical protein